ncbi:hypothetical protein EU522_00580 [Candidatus Thorarchaeota archaeon]|nr:MAG: hypothetical protein EU522_00580 [Candidatus Thorarchaeota archaeon]
MPTRPPDTVIFAVVFFAIVFILGGNIYTLIRTPPAIAGNPTGGAPLLVIPVLDQQLGLEGIVASVVVLVGSIGLGLIYYSSKYVFQPGYATRLMILGMILAGTAFLVFTYLFALKTG